MLRRSPRAAGARIRGHATSKIANHETDNARRDNQGVRTSVKRSGLSKGRHGRRSRRKKQPSRGGAPRRDGNAVNHFGGEQITISQTLERRFSKQTRRGRTPAVALVTRARAGSQATVGAKRRMKKTDGTRLSCGVDLRSRASLPYPTPIWLGGSRRYRKRPGDALHSW